MACAAHQAGAVFNFAAGSLASPPLGGACSCRASFSAAKQRQRRATKELLKRYSVKFAAHRRGGTATLPRKHLVPLTVPFVSGQKAVQVLQGDETPLHDAAGADEVGVERSRSSEDAPAVSDAGEDVRTSEEPHLSPLLSAAATTTPPPCTLACSGGDYTGADAVFTAPPAPAARERTPRKEVVAPVRADELARHLQAVRAAELATARAARAASDAASEAAPGLLTDVKGALVRCGAPTCRQPFALGARRRVLACSAGCLITLHTGACSAEHGKRWAAEQEALGIAGARAPRFALGAACVTPDCAGVGVYACKHAPDGVVTVLFGAEPTTRRAVDTLSAPLPPPLPPVVKAPAKAPPLPAAATPVVVPAKPAKLAPSPEVAAALCARSSPVLVIQPRADPPLSSSPPGKAPRKHAAPPAAQAARAALLDHAQQDAEEQQPLFGDDEGSSEHWDWLHSSSGAGTDSGDGGCSEDGWWSSGASSQEEMPLGVLYAANAWEFTPAPYTMLVPYEMAAAQPYQLWAPMPDYGWAPHLQAMAHAAAMAACTAVNNAPVMRYAAAASPSPPSPPPPPPSMLQADAPAFTPVSVVAAQVAADAALAREMQEQEAAAVMAAAGTSFAAVVLAKARTSSPQQMQQASLHK
jgi:hypothetical protein